MSTVARSATRVAILVLLLAGCQEKPVGMTTSDLDKERAAAVARAGQQPQGGASDPVKGAKGGKAAPGDAQVATNYGSQEFGYVYDPTGKKDPFRSFVLDRLKEQDENSAASPLAQFDLGQLSVTGMVWQSDRRRALVLDPSGQAYIVKVGDRIGKNEGEILEIGDASLVVRESYVDFHGDKTTKEIEMRIRQSTGG
jgi:type IV pilus assembly protein PilP